MSSDSDGGEFGTTMFRGLNFLGTQIGADGWVRGRNMYAQGIVTMALSEGHAITGAAALREPLERVSEALKETMAAVSPQVRVA